jgi:MFS transporter, AAHS family, cis,cis-muconate transporter
MNDSASLERTAKLVAVAVFVALIIDGMDTQMLALSLPSISKELRLTTVAAGALSTYTFLGMGIGGVLAGRLADRVGRARVVWWSVLTFSIFTGLIALAHTYLQIAMMRFISGFGIGAVYCTGIVLAAEYLPTRLRATIMGMLQAALAVGYTSAAMLSSYLLPRLGWRALFSCAVVPGIVTLWLLWGIPDPPNWAGSHAQEDSGVSPFRTTWGDASLRRTFLLWTVTSIALQFGYYGANTWLPSYLMKDLGINAQSTGWYVAAAYTMSVVGKVITGWFADRIGRRVLWVATGLLAAMYVPFLVHAATRANAAYLLLIFGFLFGAPYAINGTYMNESFPNQVRGTAVGTSYSIGRIGSMLSPLLIGLAASRYSIGLGIALLGISYGVAALVPGLFIREKMFDPTAVGPVRVSCHAEDAGGDAIAVSL